MAEPALVALAANQWTAVALGVTTGIVYPENNEQAEIWYTYRNAGNPAPGAFDGTEKKLKSDYAVICHHEAIDVYLFRASSAGNCTVYL